MQVQVPGQVQGLCPFCLHPGVALSFLSLSLGGRRVPGELTLVSCLPDRRQWCAIAVLFVVLLVVLILFLVL